MRNGFVSYRGGFYSRSGTAFVGFSKQTGRNYPPRLLPFQFNIKQGLVLEFGQQYMRVVTNGAFVTEAPSAITGISQADPGVVTVAPVTGAVSATSNNGAISASYAPGDIVVLAGGTFTDPTQLSVASTTLLSVQPNAAGIGYAPADTVNLGGGVQSVAAQIRVVTTTVVALPTIVNAGTGGTPGPAAVTGTTGSGTKFQANVTIDGTGVIISVDSLTVAGSYTTNPTSPAAEPITGGSLAGAELGLLLGIQSIAIVAGGTFTTNAGGGAFTQASTSGAGTGATFRNGLFGPNALTVADTGAYSVYPANPVAQASSTGAGQGATFNVTSGSVSPYSNGDWLFFAGISGMTELNGDILVVGGATPTTVSLFDVYGDPVDTTGFNAYIGGGTAARIYTLPTPYNEQDLPWLKITQSADVLTLCCVNQDTSVEYQPQDLSRLADDNWQFTPVTSVPSVQPPSTLTGAASSSGSTDYQYQVTSVSAIDGTESIASPIAEINSAVNIAGTAGTITLTWTSVAGVNQYNIYKAAPGFGVVPPVGALFGFAGTAFGSQFIDSNIVQDDTQVPPKANDPFARGRILSGIPDTGGTAYTTIDLSISTSTGSDAKLTGVLVNGAFSAVIVDDPGHDYAPTDQLVVTGDGTGATGSITIGPQTGTYPSVPSYFQERRVFADSLNQPDTYWFSQPGAFLNFDYRIPTIDSDAITGNPWSVAVDGVQWMINMPGGLVVLTGLAAWQLTGAGGSSLNPQPITPASQQAQPQAYSGVSPTLPPIKIDYEIIYAQAKETRVRDLSYQYFQNIYTGTDLTVYSTQLFDFYTLVEWAWAEEPYRLVWLIRNDGVMLSLTFLKSQEVAGWARHDTNGLFKSVCSVTESTPIKLDAVYTAVQRFPGAHNAYMIERMDNRLWQSVEDTWCVDCGLSLPQPTPSANLTVSSATGLGAISGFSNLVGGQNYSAFTTGTIVDANGQGPGTGCVVALTIAGGVIAAAVPSPQGVNYISPQLVIEDPTNAGSGASAIPILDNSALFMTDLPTFALTDVGSVIRVGGGIAIVTAYNSATSVTANITSPIVGTIPNSGGQVPVTASGFWSLTMPVSSISGLQHLAGMMVTGVADGRVVPPVLVPADGTIQLPWPASSVVMGLAFLPQLQSLYLDSGESPTTQGQRKKVAAVTARIEASAAFQIGANMPDGAVQSPIEVAPEWVGMTLAPTHGVAPYGSNVIPLFTGDCRIPVGGGFDTRGQVALQQPNPLPLNVLALINEDLPGDLPDVKARERKNSGK